MADRARCWWRTEARLWPLVAARGEELPSLALAARAARRGRRAQRSRTATTPLDVAFRPLRRARPGRSSARDPDKGARHTIKRSQKRLAKVAELVAPHEPLAAAIDIWIDALRAEAPSPEHLAKAAALHAELWESLADWLAIDDKQALPHARERFATELERTSAYLAGGWKPPLGD